MTYKKIEYIQSHITDLETILREERDNSSLETKKAINDALRLLSMVYDTTHDMDKAVTEKVVNMGSDKQIELIPDDFELQGAEFTHVFRSMMDSGTIATMSGSALKVYIIIKLRSGFVDGKTTSSSAEIGEKTGLSKSQVTRAIKELRDMGLLFSERIGRRNTYRIIERIPAVHKSGSPEAMTEIYYSKKSINKLVSSIKGQIVEKMKGMTVNGDLNIQINFNKIDKVEINNLTEDDKENLQAEFEIVEEFPPMPWKTH